MQQSLKVNRYIEQNRDHLAIYKLRNNMALTAIDYKSLEHIFKGELGTAEDYKREYQNTPFGLLVRKIAKLEYEAASVAFSEFINDQSLSQAQIVFVKKVVDYIVQNGYIENISELTKPPFDKPQSFIKLFDSTKQRQIVELVTRIKEMRLRSWANEKARLYPFANVDHATQLLYYKGNSSHHAS